MERLNTDRSIGPLVAQFVPLKVETDGDQWGPWSRKYSHEGEGIPIIFVVRADGEKMYGKSGSLGEQLPFFLRAQLLSAGTILSPAQLAQVQAAVKDAKQALEAGDTFTAVKRLDGLKKIGPTGKLGSFAACAVEADQLVAKLAEEGQAALTAAREKLGGDDKFAGTLGIISANRIYGALPNLKKDLGAAERSLRIHTSADVVAQAEALDKALALLSTKNGQQAAAAALAKVAARFPGTSAAELAQAKIEELTGQSPAAVSTAATPAAGETTYRTWTDVTGTYQVEAELVEATDAAVTLKLKKDGKLVNVPLEKLSEEDREFLKMK